MASWHNPTKCVIGGQLEFRKLSGDPGANQRLDA